MAGQDLQKMMANTWFLYQFFLIFVASILAKWWQALWPCRLCHMPYGRPSSWWIKGWITSKSTMARMASNKLRYFQNDSMMVHSWQDDRLTKTLPWSPPSLHISEKIRDLRIQNSVVNSNSQVIQRSFAQTRSLAGWFGAAPPCRLDLWLPPGNVH